MEKTELLGLSLQETEEVINGLGLPRFRARQIYHWLYKHQVHSFYQMSNLPKELRHFLDQKASITVPRVVKSRVSRDGTRKFLLELGDKKRIETVAIPQSRAAGTKYTICLSSQVGCPIGCTFCATGQSGFERDLTAGEITGQAVAVERELKQKEKPVSGNRLIANVVFMGMGEPLLNLDAVLKAISIINDEQGIGIGQRHITISTAGFIPGIKVLAETGLQVTLAVSLHATTDEVRNRIVPMNRRYGLEELLQAVSYYNQKTGRRVTFEYLLLDGVNSSIQDAYRLSQMVKPLLANVNLIPYNPIEGSDYNRPAQDTITRFMACLAREGVNVTLREEMGADIKAACGQLRVAANRRPKQEIGTANSK
ncbi:MAG: 23S rRNA (adenine(2503)-C(2))-methyltransferase RlmN [Syntrophomonadaceae bacterium]|nr:23S rRNA (adenine(2503)-C(2))-methyltransferase RlmN [Syntrophomonadaceae bacterium]